MHRNVFVISNTTHEFYKEARLASELVRIAERRQFVFDIYDRVEALAAALDRLQELYKMYAQLSDDWARAIAQQRLGNPERMTFEIHETIYSGMGRCNREARALVTFVYYELTTLVSLLRKWLEPKPGSNLEYLVGVRNKILAHPRRDGRIKNSGSALSIGPILHAHLVGAQSWIPWMRDCYLDELRRIGGQLDDGAGTAANIALLRDRTKRTDKLRPVEILRLKAYVIPEPDVLESVREMAGLLESSFIVEIEQACRAKAE